MTIEIITGPGCPKCVAAKAFMSANDIPFKETPAEVKRKFLEESGLRELPILIKDDAIIRTGWGTEQKEFVKE